MAVSYQPMRSLIYVDVVKEDYRHKLKHWLHRYHIADSISQFGPYVNQIRLLPGPSHPARRRKIRDHPHAAHRALLDDQPF